MHESAKRRGSNLTTGTITRRLVVFAVPLLGASVVQLLYSTVDLIFVGRVLGTRAAAAVGASGLLVTCLVGLFTGLGTGASVLTARYFGACDSRGISRVMHTSIAFAIALGLALIPVGLAATPLLLRALNTPGEIMVDATRYMRIYLLALVSIVVYNVGAGLLRALGDSLSPMVCQLIGGVLNVAGNALFLIGLKWGIAGSALATLCSQTVAAALVLVYLAHLDEGRRLHLNRLRIDGGTLRAVLAIGVPTGLQAVMITFSNVVVQHQINDLGVTAIAAFTAWFRVENFLYFPIMALGVALATFTAQNLGAGLVARARRGVLICNVMAAGVTATLSASLLWGSRSVFAMFSTEPAVIEVGTAIAWVVAPCYLMFAFMEMLSSTIRGAGHALVPMVIIVTLLCGLRIVLLLALSDSFSTAPQVALVYPITWTISVVALLAYYYGRSDHLWRVHRV